MVSNTETARRRPALKLDIEAASVKSHSFAAKKPFLMRSYQSPVMSLASAKRELSKHAIPECLPPVLGNTGKSRDNMQHSGDAGNHDYLHWALHHPYKRPQHQWELCGCENTICEIDSDESEPMTEEELAQSRYGAPKPLENLEGQVSPLTAEIRLDEAVGGELAVTVDMGYGPIDLDNAAFIVGERENTNSSNDPELVLGAPEVDPLSMSVEHVDSSTTQPFHQSLTARRNNEKRLNPGATSFQMPGDSEGGNQISSLRGGGGDSDSDSEAALSMLQRKGILVPFLAMAGYLDDPRLLSG
ncbi:hypothetical protein LZ30DRAFT_691824 [Colletotrichum cereale]|nr:hypothetical protein LZ30DRAFT_691824 [Colletotrichum cereale]